MITPSVEQSILSLPVQYVYLGLQVQTDFNRNKYFSAEEAQEYGVIDKLLLPPKKKRDTR